MTSTYSPAAAVFGIDPADPSEWFIGWADPSVRWNGWATPAFDADQVNRIVGWLRAAGGPDDPQATFDGTTVVVTMPGDDQPETFDRGSDGLWAVGSWGWCWDEVEGVSPDTAAAVQDVIDDIRALIASGAVPTDVREFSELHDHLDANDLGGFTDPARRAHWSTESWAEVQGYVQEWLANR